MRKMPNSLIEEHIKRWGNADAISLLDPRYSIFSVPQIEGIIGYKHTIGRAAVIADPLCAPENSAALAQAFYEYAKQYCKTVIYTAVSEKFTEWALTTIGKSALAIGNELILDPSIDVTTLQGATTQALRRKRKYAMRSNVIIREYTTYDPELEKVMKELGIRWLQERKGLQIYFSSIDIFAGRKITRWFYAYCQNKLVGLVILNRIDAHNGWVLHKLMILREDAPYGTSEFLILSILDVLRSENCRFFSVGTVPGRSLTNTYGFNIAWQIMVKLGFKMAYKLFNLSNRQQYWEKFKPRKLPSFLVFDTNFPNISDVIAILRAFNISR